MIRQISNTEFFTKSGNTELTLKHNEIYGWHIFAFNPAVRAHRTLGFKALGTLENVEKKYKAFKGISQIINMEAA